MFSSSKDPRPNPIPTENKMAPALSLVGSLRFVEGPGEAFATSVLERAILDTHNLESNFPLLVMLTTRAYM